MTTIYSQQEFDEAYEIGKREGYEKAVQEIDMQTGGDGVYRTCLGGADPERHTPDAPAMIQRILDRFEILNLLDEATKTGSDKPDDSPSPSPNVAGSSIDRDRAAKAAAEANTAYGQWMPERWLHLFLDAYEGKSR